MSSDEEHLIKKIRHNYDRKNLSDELLRIIKYYRGLQKWQVNYNDAVPSLYTHFKKSTILKGEKIDANYREIVRHNAYIKETDLNKKNIYITEDGYTRISFKEKSCNVLKKKLKVDVKSTGLMKIYVSNFYNKNRDKNFWRDACYVSTLGIRLFPSVIYLKNL